MFFRCPIWRDVATGKCEPATRHARRSQFRSPQQQRRSRKTASMAVVPARRPPEIRPTATRGSIGAGSTDDALPVGGIAPAPTNSRCSPDHRQRSWASARDRDCASLGQNLRRRSAAAPVSLRPTAAASAAVARRSTRRDRRHLLTPWPPYVACPLVGTRNAPCDRGSRRVVPHSGLSPLREGGHLSDGRRVAGYVREPTTRDSPASHI